MRHMCGLCDSDDSACVNVQRLTYLNCLAPTEEDNAKLHQMLCTILPCLASCWGHAGVMLGSCWGHTVLLYHVNVNAGVRAIVLDVDTAQRRLSLGLKASYFDGAGDAEEAVDGKAEVQLHVLTCCLGIIFDSHCT